MEFKSHTVAIRLFDRGFSCSSCRTKIAAGVLRELRVAGQNVLEYKGKWGPLSQPRKLGDGPRLMADPEYCQGCIVGSVLFAFAYVMLLCVHKVFPAFVFSR